MGRRGAAGEPLERCLIALVALLPLAWVPGLVSLYRLPKQALLAVLGAVILWGGFAAVRRRPVALPLAAPVAAHATVVLVSLAGAVNVYAGLVQAAQTLVCLGLFWTVALLRPGPGAIVRLFGWAAAGGSLVAVAGIAQAWGLALPALPALAWPPGATFGNPNTAAQYLVLVLPLAVVVFLLADGARREAPAGLAVGTILTYLVYTGTRAAWGGTLLAAGLLSLLLRGRPVVEGAGRALARRKRLGVVLILAFVAAMNVAPRLWIPTWGQSRAFLPARLAMLADEAGPGSSLRGRLAIWANTLAMAGDHPLLGVGKGNFPFVYPLYATRVVKDAWMGPEVRVREAHNDYVQMLAETGVAGGLAFAWVLGALALTFVRGLPGGPAPPPAGPAAAGPPGLPPAARRRLLGVACACALLALLAEALFDFPFQRAAPEALFWLLAGVLWRTARPWDGEPGAEAPAPVERAGAGGGRALGPLARRVAAVGRRIAPAVPAAVMAALAGVATLAAAWGVHAVRAERHYSRGGRAYYADRQPEAARELAEAVRLNPFDERYWFLLGLQEIRTGRYQDASRHILRSLALNPYGIGTLNNLGVALAAQGRVAEAIAVLERSLEIWPDHADARTNLGILYASAGRTDLARRQFEAALALDPDDARARDRLQGLRRGPAP